MDGEVGAQNVMAYPAFDGEIEQAIPAHELPEFGVDHISNCVGIRHTQPA